MILKEKLDEKTVSWRNKHEKLQVLIRERSGSV